MKDVMISVVSAAINSARNNAYDPEVIKNFSGAYAFLAMRHNTTPDQSIQRVTKEAINEAQEKLLLLIEQEKAVSKINLQNAGHLGEKVNIKRFSNEMIRILWAAHDIISWQYFSIVIEEKAI
jgi:hypothetical protein